MDSPERDATALFSAHDANLIILILLNLLQNALDACDNSASIVCIFSQPSGTYQFDVIDQGPGLPVDRLRSPFVAGRSSKVNGSGLGLAISQQLAMHLDGDLELIHSNSELGSHFRLTCPQRK
ncbi:MAG: ATP-binding protein [Verrucomicrobia bacterium]|nr:ATP-binding protein [Verrucomicrobiota bacterium]